MMDNHIYNIYKNSKYLIWMDFFRNIYNLKSDINKIIQNNHTHWEIVSSDRDQKKSETSKLIIPGQKALQT